MQLYDGRKIASGLILFGAVLSFPIWFTALFGMSNYQPELQKPQGKCIEETEYMRHWHMDLLNTWRDEVVRQDSRLYTSKASGETHEKSLSLTCLKCHEDRSVFCDRCHNYVGVQPSCWGCHVDPKRR